MKTATGRIKIRYKQTELQNMAVGKCNETQRGGGAVPGCSTAVSFLQISYMVLQEKFQGHNNKK
jgi:hypothetical protein